ncbi:hypothetical protein DL98DRAFT_653843 [Cadophora sp. DSE1049]|nr:hypothetical protein DL98DRAFT_653843 [Cadophora sp. DSE1049]
MASTDFNPMKRRKTFPASEEQLEAALPWAQPPVSDRAELPPAATSSPRIFSEAGPPLGNQAITFINASGKPFQFPFEDCQTWQRMKSLIDCANPEDSPVQDGHYELRNKENFVILKNVWEKMIKPGEEITMRWLQQPQLLSPSLHFQPQALSSPSPQPLATLDLLTTLVNEPGAISSPALQPLVLPPAEVGELFGSNEPKETKLPPVTFKVHDKTYPLPFPDCRTWEGMERCIKAACGFGQRWGSLDSHIETSAYELLHSSEGDAHVILPAVWEELVEPGWIVEMRRIPLPEPIPEPVPQPTPMSEDPPPEPAALLEQDTHVPIDAHQVHLEAKKIAGGNVVYQFKDPRKRDKWYQTQESEWLSKKIRREGRDEECFLYTGKNSGLHFWTFSFPKSSKRKR